MRGAKANCGSLSAASRGRVPGCGTSSSPGRELAAIPPDTEVVHQAPVEGGRCAAAQHCPVVPARYSTAHAGPASASVRLAQLLEGLLRSGTEGGQRGLGQWTEMAGVPDIGSKVVVKRGHEMLPKILVEMP
eukprot:jgi/Tetstr1/432431/TSEL_000194.t1